MIKTIILSTLFSASLFTVNAGAQDKRWYSYGPVTQLDRIHVEDGQLDEYTAWVTSTWAPTMEAVGGPRRSDGREPTPQRRASLAPSEGIA